MLHWGFDPCIPFLFYLYVILRFPIPPGKLLTGVIGSTDQKLSRSTIDDRRSTVILRRCDRTDRQYRPCSIVGGTEPTVDIDRD